MSLLKKQREAPPSPVPPKVPESASASNSKISKIDIPRELSLISDSIIVNSTAATVEIGSSMDKFQAFEEFKSKYASSQWIDENKQLLRQKIAFAKSLGEQAGDYRKQISRRFLDGCMMGGIYIKHWPLFLII